MVKPPIAKLTRDYHNAARRLLLLDYDGVLSELKDDPSAEASKPTRETLALLESIAAQPNTILAIITGRSKPDVDSWFKTTKYVTLIAEHGAWQRKGDAWINPVTPNPKLIESAVIALRPYEQRVPGSHIETKTFGVTWHFRRADPAVAAQAIPDIQAVLAPIVSGTEYQVYTSTTGGNIIEVKPRSIHKGSVTQELIAATKADFILAAGDDYTDEHMFEACPKSAYTIHVRGGTTAARFIVPGVTDIIAILTTLRP